MRNNNQGGDLPGWVVPFSHACPHTRCVSDSTSRVFRLPTYMPYRLPTSLLR